MYNGKFTSKAVVKAIEDNQQESRKEWLMDRIRFRGAKFVDKPEDYLYSSARDYCGGKGLIDVTVTI